MQQKLAGTMIDLLTAGEVRDALKSWSVELTRGARLRRLSIVGSTDAAGGLNIGDNRDGPEEGMVWGITRVTTITAAVIPAAGIQVYANDINPSSTLIAKLLTDHFPGDHGVVLVGGDSLRIGGTGLTANTPVTVTLGIKEVPEMMAWSL
jgi:hypothetical protein